MPSKAVILRVTTHIFIDFNYKISLIQSRTAASKDVEEPGWKQTTCRFRSFKVKASTSCQRLLTSKVHLGEIVPGILADMHLRDIIAPHLAVHALCGS
jgi:hypothetical protein